MADYIPTGSLAAFYSGNMTPPDRGPNGTLVQSQLRGQPTSLQEIYGGILPTQGARTGSAFSGGWGSDGFVLPSMNQQTQVATPMSQHISPTATNVMGPNSAQRNAIAATPILTGKDQSRLLGTDMGGPKQQPMLDTSGMIARNLDPYTNAYGSPLQSTGNAALSAIGQVSPGAMAPMPISRPMSFFAPSGGSQPQTIRRGQSNGNVSALQSQLGVKADGIFGPKTEAAVKAFQKANGLKVDGIVGPKTMAALQGGGGGVASALSRSSTAPQAKSNSVAKALSSSSAKPATYGSKGLSAEGKALASIFRKKK